MYQMKLSRSAQHEPVRGLWYRVCETCYKSREGYMDRHGVERTRMSDFESVRRSKHSHTEMEVTRLEKRLSRLTQLLANPPEEIPQPTSNKRWSINWVQNDPRKALEQSIVAWQNDAEVQRCPYCQQEFTQYTFRRHHCRTCGKVVCGDPATACSTLIGLNVATSMFFASLFFSILSCTDEMQRQLTDASPPQKNPLPTTPFPWTFGCARNATTRYFHIETFKPR